LQEAPHSQAALLLWHLLPHLLLATHCCFLLQLWHPLLLRLAEQDMGWLTLKVCPFGPAALTSLAALGCHLRVEEHHPAAALLLRHCRQHPLRCAVQQPHASALLLQQQQLLLHCYSAAS
jgi:hypothetical protein